LKEWEYDDKIIKVEEAYEPADILWENLTVGNRKKCVRQFLSWTLLLLVWFIFFCIEVIVKERQFDNNMMYTKNKVKSYTITLIVLVSNNIMMDIIKFASIYQLEPSHTKRQYNCAWKIAMVQGFNTTVGYI